MGLPHVTQVGTIPPPIGGVSVHVLRLMSVLRENQVDVSLLDLHWFPGKKYPAGIQLEARGRGLGSLLRYWWKVLWSRDLLHYHASSWQSFVVANSVLAFAWKRAFVVVTLHTGNTLPAPHSVGYRLFLHLLGRVNAFICVSEELFEVIKQAIGDGRNSQNILIRVSPYIGSGLDKSPEGSDIQHSTNSAKRSRVVVSGYGAPQYNWNFVCSLIDTMSSEVEWVCCIYGPRDPQYWPAMERELRKRSGVVIYNDLSSDGFVSILRSATVYLRPTDYDGDSVSIYEALAEDVSCVASNVVKRPSGAICYEHNNRLDCMDKLIQAEMRRPERCTMDRPSRKEREALGKANAMAILNVYRGVVARGDAGR